MHKADTRKPRNPDTSLCQKIYPDQETADFYNLSRLWGELDSEKLNVNGSGIALGHPVGSTGSRIMVTLMHELSRRKGKYGIASLCIGGGQGGAVIIENLKR